MRILWRDRFLFKRYKITSFLGWKLSVTLREMTGIAPVYGLESINKKVIFIHIPKAAGSSVGELIYGTDNVGHYPFFIYKSVDEKRYEEYYKFTVVRNPYDRFISAYDFVLKGGKGPADERCGKYIRSRSDNIEDFVLNYLDEGFIYSWAHFVPQTYFICDGDRLVVDDIFHVENLSNDIEVLRKRLNISKELMVVNKGTL
jgi:chondroitin 4-sulfotransferase 11